MQSNKKKNAFRIVFVIMLLAVALLGIYDYIIPESISVFSHSAEKIMHEEMDIPFVSAKPESVPTLKRVSQEEGTESFCTSLSVDTRLFGVVPLKTVNIDVYKDISLYPGGMPFGVKLYTDGVIVAGVTAVETEKGKKTPASDCGIKPGDIITAVNSKAVTSTDEVSSAIEQSGGNSLVFTVKRGSKIINLELTPVFSKQDNSYRGGLWLRDSTAGIGTVTFICGENGYFGGLGHGICDVDTGELMPLRKGTVVDVTIKGITKGLAGTPGELRGSFAPGKIGALTDNTACGVYGVLSELPNLEHSKPLKIGLKEEVTAGEAEIYCTVGNEIGKYSAEIVKIVNRNGEQKNFVIKITDKRLLEATGGIVQGMSGSPIIQNGKLVGAVTHVLVNDPTKGYGIFIENMLKNIPG